MPRSETFSPRSSQWPRRASADSAASQAQHVTSDQGSTAFRAQASCGLAGAHGLPEVVGGAWEKLVIAGEGACGKTCLLIIFSKYQFTVMYVPTVFENYVAAMEEDGKKWSWLCGKQLIKLAAMGRRGVTDLEERVTDLETRLVQPGAMGTQPPRDACSGEGHTPCTIAELVDWCSQLAIAELIKLAAMGKKGVAYPEERIIDLETKPVQPGAMGTQPPRDARLGHEPSTISELTCAHNWQLQMNFSQVHCPYFLS
ncbi:Transforming protein RhoA [Galemys pyrenaicus]|uniref:Transforming protein RhoA n=1 Tax=Galemys pyrenaicus TaxID=202257 RepID=A0A8J6AMU7_GALPY|nr:Transforming protein RhoA [Galemys pyrenaicus]